MTKHILITGASSGIGRALALDYAEDGVHLALTGRDSERLEEVATACRARGAKTAPRVIDVRERSAMADWIGGLGTLDLVIANAGVSSGTSGADTGDSEETARAVFAVNIDGVLNTVYPALAPMKERGAGQIAIMASIAAFRGLPNAPAYSASKAAVKAWGEALRPVLAPAGIQVSVIFPGYVESRITDQNTFPMPFFMDSEKAARIIRRGLERDKGRIVFPWPMHAAGWLLGALPVGLTDRVLGRMPRKE